MSAGLNTAAGTLYEDFIDGLMPKNRSEWAASLVMKITVVIIGAFCVGLVYVVERLSTIVEVAYSLAGSPNAALFSAFALGLFFPWANSKVLYQRFSRELFIKSKSTLTLERL